MRASYGTTKYCMAFLRGVSCTDHTCMNLHEWGDEKDCFTKEDLTTLYVDFRNLFMAWLTHFQEAHYQGHRKQGNQEWGWCVV